MTFEVKMNIEFTDDDIEKLLEVAFGSGGYYWSNRLKLSRLYDNDSHLGFVDGAPLKLYDNIEDESYVLDIDMLRRGLNTWLNDPENHIWLADQLIEIESGAGGFDFSPLVADEIVQVTLFNRVMF